MRYTREHDSSPTRWDGLASGDPAVVGFYYRQSLHPIVSTTAKGQVFWNNPPMGSLSGNAGARLDMRGRLLSFYYIPPQVESEESPAPAREADWGPLLAETGLDTSALRRVPSRWTPPFYVDVRAAWEGSYPGRPEVPVRIEAAAYRGTPAAFYLVLPWTRPERMEPPDFTRSQLAALVIAITLLLTLLTTGGVLARRNMLQGRGDRRGAFRIAAYVFGVFMAMWVLRAHHVMDLTGEALLVFRGAGLALVMASTLWLFYMALEPYVRRLRPQTLISWTRLLSGGASHPIVGRDVLIGATWGAACAVVVALAIRLPASMGWSPLDLVIGELEPLLGPGPLLGFLLGWQIDALAFGLGALLLFLVLRLLLKHDLAAAVVLVAVLTVFEATAQEGSPWVRLGVPIVLMGTYTLLLLRLGLLAAIVALYVSKLLIGLPLTTSLGSWHSAPTIAAGVIVTAIAVYGFRAATRTVRRA
jgi:hypothetical protein